LPQPLHRPELKLELARFRDIGVGRIERTVRKSEPCAPEKCGGGQTDNCCVQFEPSLSKAIGAELGRNAVLGSRESANAPTGKF
jgi:hypothetical protein